MGLFDSIRRVVGGGDDGAAESDETTTQPGLVDTRDLDVSALRERAGGVADEVSVLDFSLDSLAQFDDAIDAGYDEALATSDKPGTYATDTVRFGCYLGEVLVRIYDGEWTHNPDWGVTIAGPDGTTTVAVFDVAERSITTGAVFAAVADRAADEVGLDGPPAENAEPATDSQDTQTDDGETATVDPDTPTGDDAEPEAEEPTEEDPFVEEPTEEDPFVEEPTEEDPFVEEPTEEDDLFSGPPSDAEPEAEEPTEEDDDPSTEEPSGASPPVGAPSGDVPPTEPSEPDTAAGDTDGVPDPATADSSLSEAAREAVERVMTGEETDSLIEEAEPAGDTPSDESEPRDEPTTGDDPPGPATEPDGASGTADASESQFADGTDSATRTDEDVADDDRPSLFEDEATGAGPTVDDAPSAADGLSAADASDATADDAAAVSDSDDAPPADASGGDARADDSGSDAPADPSSDARADDADPTAGDDLRATYAESAEELVSFWTEYDLDYSPDSLERLDALVSEEWDDDRFDDAAFGSDDSFDDRVFTSVSTELGSYFGEVLVRELDAEWSDETATDGVVVEGADGPLAIPVFKVAGTSIKQQPVFARSYDSLLSDLNG
jgi:hypothetical protein